MVRLKEAGMAVTLMCPNLRCRKILMVADGARGSRVRCAYCGTHFVVPKQKGPGRRSKPAEAVSAEVVEEATVGAPPGGK